jgi:hypothetical protein
VVGAERAVYQRFAGAKFRNVGARSSGGRSKAPTAAIPAAAITDFIVVFTGFTGVVVTFAVPVSRIIFEQFVQQ